MVSIKDAVIPQTEFIKLSTYKLSNNISDWNDEIMSKFFEEINYIPKEYNVDIVVNNIDEDKGYAKGSIVVSYNNKQINFPIIVNNYQLSPFDTFVHQDKDIIKYYPANIINMTKLLISQKIGKPEDIYKDQGNSESIKSVGGVYPKRANTIGNIDDASYPTFAKLSSWNKKILKEDLEKFAIQLESDPTISQKFVENTGDLMTNLIDLETPKVIPNNEKSGVLDVNDVIQAKRVVTTIDSQIFDVNKLQPMIAPTVCELRIYEQPSLEQFIESGNSAIGRFESSNNGIPISGVVLDYKKSSDLYDSNECATAAPLSGKYEEKNKDKMLIKNRRDQIFISLDGNLYSEFSDYDKKGIGFYGLKTLTGVGALEKAIDMIKDNTNNDIINISSENKNDGADKSFNYIKDMNQGIGYNSFCSCDSSVSSSSSSLIIIYGANNSYECILFNDKFKKIKINDNNAYVSNESAIIPANIISVQKVTAVKNPIYKMALGNVKNIYLIPESSIVINTQRMRYIPTTGRNGFMTPSLPIKEIYENSGINEIKIKATNDGYKIKGTAFDPLKKVAHLVNPLSTIHTKTVLKIMGMSDDMIKIAMTSALLKLSNNSIIDKDVSIFGVNDDYINPDSFKSIEKKANIDSLFSQISDKIKLNLVKEASELASPDAVDVVLSLNFINKDSLIDYVDNIDEMEKVVNELSKYLIASRMGLTMINESATKKAIDGITEVIQNLEQIKIAIGK
jgi:hypothetical protein